MIAWEDNILELFCRDATGVIETTICGSAAAAAIFDCPRSTAAKRFYPHNVHFASCFESS
jgi:hypothetical protein